MIKIEDKIDKREYGLDLLRIYAMLGIVTLHILGHGGVLANCVKYSGNYFIFWIIEIIAFSSVNIFAFLTGYLYIEKKEFKEKKIFNLILTVFFYCCIITIMFYSMNWFKIRNEGISELLLGLAPSIKGHYWYLNSYIFLFVLIPYLNRFIVELDKKSFKKLLIILFIFFSIITTVFMNDIFKISNGYSPFWLIYCYLIGAYLKLFGIKIKSFWCIVNVLIILLLKVFENSNELYSKMIESILQYNCPLILINAIVIFNIFKNIKISNKFIKKMIVWISNTCFGVYIIHVHPYIYNFLLKDCSAKYAESEKSIIIVSGMIFGIFLLCSIVELIRLRVGSILKNKK